MVLVLDERRPSLPQCREEGARVVLNKTPRSIFYSAGNGGKTRTDMNPVRGAGQRGWCDAVRNEFRPPLAVDPVKLS